MKGKFAASLVCALSGLARAQGVPPESGEEIQRRQQQQLDAARGLSPLVDVFTLTSASAEVDLAHLPDEAPCFPIHRIVLAGNVYSWLPKRLQPVVGQCVGQQGLGQIQTAANNALIARGYVTSRVLIPAQSLDFGQLDLQLVPGRISAIRAVEPTIGSVGVALPVSIGGLLNQRDIDQGLENLRRLQSEADAKFDIALGCALGGGGMILFGVSDMAEGASGLYNRYSNIGTPGVNPLRYGLNEVLPTDWGNVAYDELNLMAAIATLRAPVPLKMGNADGLNRPGSMFDVTVPRIDNKTLIPFINQAAPYGTTQGILLFGAGSKGVAVINDVRQKGGQK